MALDDHADLGTFFLRIGLGAYFLWTGIMLLWRPDLQAEFARLLSRTPLTSAGFLPGQAVMVIYVAYVLIGVLLLLGLFTRMAGFLTVVIAITQLSVLNWQLTLDLAGSLGILFMVKDIILLAAGASLFFTGARIFAVDKIMVD